MPKPQTATAPLTLKASESVSFTANDIDELQTMIDMWKKELLPFLFDDVDPTPPKGRRGPQEQAEAETPAPPDEKPEAKIDVSDRSEDQLADLYRQRTGKRFMYVPLTKHQGKDRRTALLEALQ